MIEFAYTALWFFVATSVFAGLSYCILYPIFNNHIRILRDIYQIRKKGGKE